MTEIHKKERLQAKAIARASFIRTIRWFQFKTIYDKLIKSLYCNKIQILPYIVNKTNINYGIHSTYIREGFKRYRSSSS